MTIKRKDGTTGVIRFKSYEQGREAAQSEAVDFIICDEMPTDMGLWSELLARLSATSGRIWLQLRHGKQQSGNRAVVQRSPDTQNGRPLPPQSLTPHT